MHDIKGFLLCSVLSSVMAFLGFLCVMHLLEYMEGSVNFVFSCGFHLLMFSNNMFLAFESCWGLVHLFDRRFLFLTWISPYSC